MDLQPAVQLECFDSASELPRCGLEWLQRFSPLTTIPELERQEWMQLGKMTYFLAAGPSERIWGLLPMQVVADRVAPECDPARIFHTVPHASRRPVAVLGSCGGYVNHLAVSPEVPAGLQNSVACALIEAATRQAERSDAAVAVMPHLTGRQRELMRTCGLPCLAEELTYRAIMDIPYVTFDEYLADLPHRHRADIKGERNRFTEGFPDICELPLSDVCEELAPLLAQVERRYGRDCTSQQMAWYLALSALAMGDRGPALVLRQGGRAIAFTVLWRYGADWYVRAWGCDDEMVGRNGVYFNMTIYEPMMRAIGNGAERLHLGVGALAAKQRRGARREPLYSILALLGSGSKCPP